VGVGGYAVAILLARDTSIVSLRAERDSLAADKVRLEEIVRGQDALLTASAHDLKNALAAIAKRADLLQDELSDGAPQTTTPGAL
jgi:hypothetical protein